MGADENVDDDLRNYVWKGPLIGGGVTNVMLHVPYNRELDIRNELIVLTGQYMNEVLGIAYRTTSTLTTRQPLLISAMIRLVWKTIRYLTSICRIWRMGN